MVRSIDVRYLSDIKDMGEVAHTEIGKLRGEFGNVVGPSVSVPRATICFGHRLGG